MSEPTKPRGAVLRHRNGRDRRRVKPRSRGGSVPLVASQKSALSPERPRWLCNLSGKMLLSTVSNMDHKKTNDVGRRKERWNAHLAVVTPRRVKRRAAGKSCERKEEERGSVSHHTYVRRREQDQGGRVDCLFFIELWKKKNPGLPEICPWGGKRAPVVPRARVAVSATTTRCQGGALLLSCIYPPAPRNTGAPRPNKRTLGLFFNRKVGSRKVGPKATPGGLVSF